MGEIEFTLSGGNISVVSFSQDSYLNTAGGTFYQRAPDVSGMTGNVDAAGNMTFDPTGRMALFLGFTTSLGENPWNIDNTSDGFGTGLYETWVTGTSSNRHKGTSAGFTLTGSPLQDAGGGTWTGTLVSAGNVGSTWGGFNNVQYSEVYNVTISESEGPVPRVNVETRVQGGVTQECGGNRWFNSYVFGGSESFQRRRAWHSGMDS